MPSWLTESVVTTVVALASLAFAIWSHHRNRLRARLVWAFQPPTVVARSGGAIGITFEGKPLNAAEVSSVRIYFWNAGNAPVRPEAALMPLTVGASLRTLILGVNVVKVSRPEINLSPESTTFPARRVPLCFRILEPGDGLSMDVLFSTTDPLTESFPVLVGSFEAAGSVELVGIEPGEGAVPRPDLLLPSALLVGFAFFLSQGILFDSAVSVIVKLIVVALNVFLVWMLYLAAARLRIRLNTWVPSVLK